jgi:hypothetical protein
LNGLEISQPIEVGRLQAKTTAEVVESASQEMSQQSVLGMAK